MMDSMKLEEDMPLQFKILSNAIETAQSNIESRHFAARKSVLEYDDVMNQQREKIYAERNKVLNGDDIRASIISMINGTIDAAVATYLGNDPVHDNWNLEGLRRYTFGWITDIGDLQFDVRTLEQTEPEDVAEFLKEKALKKYEQKEALYGEEKVREMERFLLLRAVDINWMEHIDAMDELRRGIGLRAYGQHDPIIAYRNESYDMFNAMTETIRETTAKTVLQAVIRENTEIKREKVAEENPTASDSGKGTTVRGKGVVSKNALCPCGSGKKYKRCCGKDE